MDMPLTGSKLAPPSVDEAPQADPAEIMQSIPEAYRNRLSPDDWLSMPESVRNAVLEREDRGVINRREESQRIYSEIGSMVKEEVGKLLQSQQAEKPKSNGQGASSWEDMDDGDFYQLYDEATRALELAASNPEDEEVVSRAKRITPSMQRQFAREDARRQAAKLVSEQLGRYQQQEQVKQQHQTLKAKIVSEFGGGEGEAILSPGHPLKEAAERHYMTLKEANGGADAPGLAYAAYKAAALELGSRGQAGKPRRDLEMESLASSNLARTSAISARRKQGDQLGASLLALDDFLNDRNVPGEYIPEHVRRRMQR